MELREAVRDTAGVLEAHLRLRCCGDLERDLDENYAGEVVLFTHEGVYRGHAGVREASCATGASSPR